MTSFKHPYLLLSALLLPILAHPAGATQRAAETLQESEATPADDATATLEAAAALEEDARERRRLVHLSGGGVMRGKSRFVDDHWEVRGKQGWRALPASAVTHVRSEKEALRESKRRVKAIGRQPSTDASVELASWMISEGLHTEAFGRLDRVLEVDPDHEQALAAMPEGLMPVPRLNVAAEQAPQARAALYSFGAGATPSGREYAVRELRKEADAEVLRAELAQELRSHSLRRRSFAALALGRLQPGEELKNLLVHAILDPSEEARRTSAQALAATNDPGVLVPMIRALSSKSSRVRTQAAEALGNARMEAAVEPLLAHLSSMVAAQSSSAPRRVPHGNIFVGKQSAYIQDFDVEVAQFQAVADPQVNVLIEGAVLDAGVHSRVLLRLPDQGHPRLARAADR